MTSISDQAAFGRRVALPLSPVTPPGVAGSTGAEGAERSELAVDAAALGGVCDGVLGWTSAVKKRSPIGGVVPDTPTERTAVFNMLQRHDVQVLLRGGVNQARIRQLTGISERTIRRIGREDPADPVETGVSRPHMGRPSLTAGFQDRVRVWLRDAPDLKSVEILRRMKLAGYTGGRTAAYELVASLRPEVAQFKMRFEGLPGEFSQHDFGEVKVCYANGQSEIVHFFASRLKYSRLVQVTVVEDQKAESLIRALMRHFAGFGGVPLLAVFDRPKTIALKWKKDGTVIEWNRTFSRAIFEFGVGVELCWPYQPQQKGSVENLVGWVKGSFFSQRRFENRDDLLLQLADWVLEVNTLRPCRATGVIPVDRYQEELDRLRPMRFAPEAYALRYDAGVGPTAEVSFEGAVYSVDPSAVGLPAELLVYPDRIRIVAGRFIADHPRMQSGGRSILPEHRAAQVAAVSGRRGKRYLRRQHLLELGPEVFRYLSEVVHRRPMAWSQDVDIMHRLLEEVGEADLKHAVVTAARASLFGGEYVQWCVDHPLDVPAEVNS